MPTNIFVNTRENVDDSTVHRSQYQRSPNNYPNYPLALKIDSIDKHYLESQIITGKELCFIKLSTLCQSYFPNPKLLSLANVTYGQDGEGIGNSPFFVCIGTKSGYNKVLKATPTSKSNKSRSLFITNNLLYEKLFVGFLKPFFNRDEADVLEKTYTSDNILTVSIFYREHQKRKSGKIFLKDHLLAVASFVVDEHPSCLLTWLGIDIKFPCKKPSTLSVNIKDQLNNMRGAFKFGSFLICTCQWLKSMLSERWVPVVCQVYRVATKGPYMFYKKIFFLQLLRDHALIHQQYFFRREHVIDDDEQLHWLALFQPLQYLTMFDIENKQENESILSIFDKAKFFFLEQKRFEFCQDRVKQMIDNALGTTFSDNKSFSVVKRCQDNVLQKADIDEKGNTKTTEITASTQILNALLFDKSQSQLKSLNWNFSMNDLNPSSYIFLLASKAFFGSASYHYIIRQFFYFVYRSLSMLKSTHQFFTDVMPELANLIIERTYLNDQKYGISALISINGLPDDVNEMKEAKSGKILKMYYKKLLALYSESFLRSKFTGDESDLFIINTFFNYSFSIIEITTEDKSPLQSNYYRPWSIEVNCNNYFVSPSIEKVQMFIQYCRSIIHDQEQQPRKLVWFARYKRNDIYILTETQIIQETILRLPDQIGGQVFVLEDVRAEPFDPFAANDEPIDNATRKDIMGEFNLILERVEEEASQESIWKLYQKYIKERRWHRYSKLLDVNGGELKHEKNAIGPLFDFSEDTYQRIVPTDLILTFIRVIDPWKELYESNNFVVKNKASFRDLITFREKTWLSDYAATNFIDILNDPKNGFSSKSYVLNAVAFGLLVTSMSAVQKFIEKLPPECVQILIFYCCDNHYMVVEIDIPTSTSNSVQVRIADSQDKESLENLIEEVRYGNVDILATAFNPYLPVEYSKASDVLQQENQYDCGICSLQRIYFLKKYESPKVDLEELQYLKNTVNFRIFALATILDHYRMALSPLVYVESSVHQKLDEKKNN